MKTTRCGIILYNLAASPLRSFSLRLTSIRISILLIHYRCELDLQRTSLIVNTEDARDHYVYVPPHTPHAFSRCDLFILILSLRAKESVSYLIYHFIAL